MRSILSIIPTGSEYSSPLTGNGLCLLTCCKKCFLSKKRCQLSGYLLTGHE